MVAGELSSLDNHMDHCVQHDKWMGIVKGVGLTLFVVYLCHEWASLWSNRIEQSLYSHSPIRMFFLLCPAGEMLFWFQNYYYDHGTNIKTYLCCLCLSTEIKNYPRWCRVAMCSPTADRGCRLEWLLTDSQSRIAILLSTFPNNISTFAISSFWQQLLYEYYFHFLLALSSSEIIPKLFVLPLLLVLRQTFLVSSSSSSGSVVVRNLDHLFLQPVSRILWHMC